MNVETVNDRCARCTTPDPHQELLRVGVVEAARHFLAANLVAEKIGNRMSEEVPGSIDAYEAATWVATEALQGLRDACFALRRAG